jgi:ABC-type cobalamin/Fe3+-siderophores transport system ATPase subunit
VGLCYGRMTPYIRTRIEGLTIERYRSIKELRLDLREKPDIVALYGPNGSGKSNILQAIRLALNVAKTATSFPSSAATAVAIARTTASTDWGMRGDDFRHRDLEEIRIGLDIALGRRVSERFGVAATRLQLLVIIAARPDGQLAYWFDQALVDGRIPLGFADDPRSQQANATLTNAQQELDRTAALIAAHLRENETLAASARPLAPPPPPLPPGASVAARQRHGVETKAHLQAIAGVQAATKARAKSLATLEQQQENLKRRVSDAQGLIRDALVARHVRAALGRLIQVSEAYRVPGDANDPQLRLYDALLSEDSKTYEAAQRLGARLAEAGLFGEKERVFLRPSLSKAFDEKQVRVQHPHHGELPLRNLGTGEQQLILMLGQRVITPFPIALLEEPEAHLHPRLMATLSRVLRATTEERETAPDVDQLFLATHHRHFALAAEFLDVSLADGDTSIRWRRRDEVADHAWEPGPYWLTLSELVESGMVPRDAVVGERDDGTPVHAQEVLDSLREDPPTLALEFAHQAARAFVASLVKEAGT